MFFVLTQRTKGQVSLPILGIILRELPLLLLRIFFYSYPQTVNLPFLSEPWAEPPPSLRLLLESASFSGLEGWLTITSSDG